MRATRRSALLAAALLAAGSAGCETFGPRTCDASIAANPPVRYSGGVTQGCVYTSSAQPDGGPFGAAELLYFPGGMHYEIDLGAHCNASWVQAYVSFDQNGTLDGGSLAAAAGNQALIFSPTDGGDGSSIMIANDSCVDYWLLVVAGISPTSACKCQ